MPRRRSEASRGAAPAEDYVNIAGHAHAPDAWLTSPSAHWVGLGGVGDRLIDIDSDVLEILTIIKNITLDPTPGCHESWLDAQASPEEGASQLTSLFDPSGFSLSLRVHLPTAGGSDPYCYYEAEISGWLTVVDTEAETPQDFFGVEMFVQADYYDEAGGVL